MKLIFHRGPVIPNIESLVIEEGQYTVTFISATAAAIAHLATGWRYFSDDRTLDIVCEGNGFVINPPKDPSVRPRVCTGWSLAEDRMPRLQ